jgi:hypothetical protein
MSISTELAAKRGPVAKVQPLIVDEIEYRVNNSGEKVGVIEAWNKTSGIKLWEKQVYSYLMDPFLERDVQWVFITSLSLDNSKRMIRVSNEKGDIFFVDLDPPHPQDNKHYYYFALVLVTLAFVSLLIWRKRKRKQR